MFGVLVSGRMVQTDFERVGENGFITNIQNAENVNHICVFMTGEALFPVGFGALVYFSWPSEGENINWQLLGYITNDKPSAVFKISGLKNGPEIQQAYQQFLVPQHGFVARVGINIVTLPTIQHNMVTQEAVKTEDKVGQFADFSQKMLENFLNYTGSFTVTQSDMVPNPNESYVPLSVIKTWYDNFLRKLAYNPNFWKT